MVQFTVLGMRVSLGLSQYALMGTTAAVAVGLWVYARCKQQLPRHWHSKVHRARKRTIGRGFDAVLHDAYAKDKVPDDTDVLIIGSGLSGLFCGAMLAKMGQVVVVLEHSHTAGGCLQSFVIDGLRFELGCHAVGMVPQRYGPLIDLLSSSMHQVRWRQIGSSKDQFVFDMIEVNGVAPFEVNAGKSIVESLVARFPDEQEAIEQYAKLVRMMNTPTTFKLMFGTQSLPYWQQWLIQNVLYARQYRQLQALAGKTLLQVLQGLTQNQELIAILTARFDIYALPPDRVSFFAHALAIYGFHEGAYFPVGGPATIAAALCDTIIEAGGKVLVDAPVERVIVDPETHSVVGVQLASGDEIRLDGDAPIISSIGLHGTRALIPEQYASLLLPPPCPQGNGHVMAFVGLQGSPHELRLPPENHFLIHTSDLDIAKFFERVSNNPFGGDIVMRITFPCAKDSAWASLYPGRSNCMVLMTAPSQWFKDLDAQGYTAFKEDMGKLIQRMLIRRFPQLADRIVSLKIATPATLERYLRRESSYGLEHSPQRYTNSVPMRPRTPLSNLFLTGQDVVTHLLPGAIESAVLTMQTILGYTAMDMFVWNRSLIGDFLATNAAEIAIRRPRERVKEDDMLGEQ